MTPATSQTDRWRTVRTTFTPLLVDVALPTGLYYALTASGVPSTPALVMGGVIPFARAVRSTIRTGKPDHLAALMAALFALSVVLAVVTGSPKAVLMRESIATMLVGLWFLATLFTAHPMTQQTARPVLTRGRPEALAAWDRLTAESPAFRSAQRTLAALWGFGLLAEAPIRLAIVLHYPVHTAAGLVNVATLGVIGVLCILSGPAGGLRSQRMLTAQIAESGHGPMPLAAPPDDCRQRTTPEPERTLP